MEVQINYRAKRLGRSTAFVDGKKTSIEKAEKLVAGKTPKVIKQQQEFNTLIYIL